MNKELTPIEWLVNELGLDCTTDHQDEIQQALKMEENMVCDSWDDGYEKGLRTREEKITDPVFNSKHYYDTNYKKEEQ
jgi:hypothetical protein